MKLASPSLSGWGCSLLVTCTERWGFSPPLPCQEWFSGKGEYQSFTC